MATSKSKSALAPGQVLFDFGKGAEPTTLAIAREWLKTRSQQNYAERKASVRELVSNAVTAAVEEAEIAFITIHADAVVSDTDFLAHESNVRSIKRNVARLTYIENGYGTCKRQDCDNLTSPRASGQPYDFCRDHSFSSRS